MASGIPAGILPDHAKGSNVVIFLLTNPQPLAQYAGQAIKVDGKAYEEKHAIDVKHLYVKQGSDWKEVRLHDAHHEPGDADAGQHKDHADHDIGRDAAQG